MAKIDLTSLDWCDLIFIEKNKEYGAYKMRKDSAKRHNVAVLVVLVVALVGFSLPKLIEFATPEQKEVMTEVTEFTALDKPDEPEEVKKVEPLTPPPPPLKSSLKFTVTVIKQDDKVREEDELKSQQEVTEATVAISIADIKGTDETHGKDIADIKQAVTQQVVEEEKPYEVVEQMPSFPGGQAVLMKYIADHLKYPTIAQENGTQGRVICQFVVAKDGSVQNVKVVRSLDPYCDKEAVRVIQSLPKWIPGKQNGKAVPVYYTVPILFKLQ